MGQRFTRFIALAGMSAAAACTGKAADSEPVKAEERRADVAAEEPAATLLTLADSPTAVAMPRPVLPAFVAGDCPGPDRCEFGKVWDVCEPVPLLREPRDGAAILRQLAANESFVAESGRIELVAPGKIRVNQTTNPAATGGIAIARNTIIEAYGPLQTSRSLFYDPNSGKGWTPPAASDEPWLWEGEVARLVEAPRMTWWVQIRLKDGQSGWLQLKSTAALDSFPVYDSAAVVRSWDINLTRDDETPDCAGLLELRRDETR